MWDSDLGRSKISALAQCRSFELGNVVSWKRSLWNTNKAVVIDINHSMIFCQREKQLVIFPQPEALSIATQICEIHGGSLVVPQSEQENKKVMELLMKHKTKCMDNYGTTVNKDKAVWLGLQRIGMNWQDRTSGYFLTPNNYSNWRHNGVQYEQGCAYMDNNGVWVASYFVSFCNTKN